MKNDGDLMRDPRQCRRSLPAPARDATFVQIKPKPHVDTSGRELEEERAPGLHLQLDKTPPPGRRQEDMTAMTSRGIVGF